MGKLLKHLKTIRTHRKFVRKACFKMGLFWQGILHDLSKYSIEELKMCKYWTGKGSPHQACRDAIGYSPSWIHHYHTWQSANLNSIYDTGKNFLLRKILPR